MDTSKDRLIVVSVDSHAQAPMDAWAQYLDPQYHDLLPGLREESAAYTTVMSTLAGRLRDDPAFQEVYDLERAYRGGGFDGVWEPELRLKEMDREGIAGEFVYHGDHRATSMFYNVFNRKYDLDACEAGMRAYHRWVSDTFGAEKDRLFLVGAGSLGYDVDATVAEFTWLADHGFAGTFAPGFTGYPGFVPLFDERWEPVWTVCEARGLPLFVHAGHGLEHGTMYPAVAAVKQRLDEDDADVNEVITWATRDLFTGEFFSDATPRRAMWQLMFGGVFDRHPDLKLVMTEVRADWMPATLRFLDEVYLRHRDDLPARHSPSEYWHRSCLTSLSFVHRAEVDMRHELGIATIAFGRDYPHNESTWPNTLAWLRDAFHDVPENEVRLMLGENVIRELGLDRDALAAVAARIGPTVDQITGPGPDADPALINHFDLRGGYLKPPEGDAKLPQVSEMVREDLVKAGIDA